MGAFCSCALNWGEFGHRNLIGNTSIIPAVPSLLPLGFPPSLVLLIWSSVSPWQTLFHLPSLSTGSFFFLLPSCCFTPSCFLPAPSVMYLLSIAPPGTLICCSFPYRLYTMNWGFVCMCVCDSIKQNTIKSGKTERNTDRPQIPALQGLSLSVCELSPSTACSCRHMGLLVATCWILCLGFPSLCWDPGLAATSAPLSGTGAAPSDQR